MSTLSDPLEHFPCCLQVYYHHADVKQVDVPSFSGSFGILPEHVPLLAVLKPGVVSVTEQDGSVKQYFGVHTFVWL